MNVVLEAEGTGPVENGWLGRAGALGEAVVHFAMADARCVMVTRPTAGLAEDTGVLRAIAAGGRLEVPGIGAYPCAGVYGVVAQSGLIRVGDALELLG